MKECGFGAKCVRRVTQRDQSLRVSSSAPAISRSVTVNGETAAVRTGCHDSGSRCRWNSGAVLLLEAPPVTGAGVGSVSRHNGNVMERQPGILKKKTSRASLHSFYAPVRSYYKRFHVEIYHKTTMGEFFFLAFTRLKIWRVQPLASDSAAAPGGAREQ